MHLLRQVWHLGCRPQKGGPRGLAARGPVGPQSGACARVPGAADDPKPTGLSGQLVDTACRVCQAYLGQLEHEDIDVSEDAAKDLTEDEWQELIQQYYSLVQ